MPYTVSHKPQATSHKPWQLYAQNLAQHTVVDSFHRSDNLVPDLIPDLALASAPKLKYACIPTLGQVLEANLAPCRRHNRQPGRPNRPLPSIIPLRLLQSLPPNRQLPPLSLIKRPLRLGSSLKRCLALMPWLLLPYATTTQALSATTAQVIHGTEPYLTFDNGVTKVTTTDALLGITITDGTTQTTYTPATNTSTAANPIVLPVVNQRFTDIGMLVPTNTNSIALNTLIGARYNYWGDDDGDGQGDNGITATGTLSVRITDKDNEEQGRGTVLNVCGAPYKVELTSTAGSLTTQYGVPNSSSFSGGTVTYYISPKTSPMVCYARPSLTAGSDRNAGPTNIWSPTKGFSVQTTSLIAYGSNFPTTGANGLYFDLLVGGIDAATLTWPTVTQGAVTATMTVNPPVDSYFNPDGASSVRVTLNGPAAPSSIWNYGGELARPTFPLRFVIVGKDSSNREVVKYAFELQRWFVSRGNKNAIVNNSLGWCDTLRNGYTTAKIKDLTNARCQVGAMAEFSCDANVARTDWPSSGNYYQRNIGNGFFTEWGAVSVYTGTDFFGVSGGYWTKDSYNRPGYGKHFFTVNGGGFVYWARGNDLIGNGICFCGRY